MKNFKNTNVTTTLFILLLILINTCSYSQGKIITGNVTAFKVYPLNGVTVETKKTKEVVKTDSLGNFTIKCAKKDVLKFNAYGFQQESIKVKNEKNIHVNLIYVENENSYKDILKYNYLSKKSLDFCINTLLEDNNNYDRFTSIADLVQTICPSAKFSIDPENGREIVTVETRGPNTFFAAPDALLVVDGVVVESITSIHPSLIKTIKVLVGNEAGHWGVRGGNGAIEITLKHGI
ncbi:carboxypeptidase-like regulatory domain-containing protein [Lutibacter sp. TH_r2]|uniref:carboxypeptidase-like regulatory domain-containing protein n=1 Tax=Lutibacter sp. TH_r2 TaxID=3082083 RepID=UPI00295500B1|nr:carboxypeptidase-like regulatory domain-containing protein [Lutibacter sp. TH_r2]MDV7185781.1 carboxypeptidase-like regulatory domain-containing protein [Lutibacter sp. TH_r2]